MVGNQRVDVPAHVRTADNGLPQKRLEKDLCWIVIPLVPLMSQSVKEVNGTGLKENWSLISGSTG